MILFVAVEEVEVVEGEDLDEDEVEGADEVRFEGDHRLEEVLEEPEAQLVTEFFTTSGILTTGTNLYLFVWPSWLKSCPNM